MKYFNKITVLPRPTPLHRLYQIEKYLHFLPLFAKRDDLLGRGLGGIKLRKLEYIFHQVFSENANVVITTGAINSNHSFYTALLAKMFSLKCILFLVNIKGSKDTKTGKLKIPLNDLMSKKLNADIHMVDEVSVGEVGKGFGIVSEATEREVTNQISDLIGKLKKKGDNPFFIPAGSVSPRGCFAMIEAFEELDGQMMSEGFTEYDIFVPVGTGGTFSGLWVASSIKSRSVHIYGISIGASNPLCKQIVIEVTMDLCKTIDVRSPDFNNCILIDDFIGDGYGYETELSKEAVELAFEKEGLLLDHTYSGKCFGALLSLIRTKRADFTRPIVFWDTGGAAESIGWFYRQ